MVGVRGKSQACDTCRQRRVKCDLARPVCQRCVLANRACAGYDRDLVFVNRTPSAPKTTALSVLADLKAQGQVERSSATSSTPVTESTVSTPAPLVSEQIPYGGSSDIHRLFAESEHDCHQFRSYAVELLQETYLPRGAIPSPDIKTNDGAFSWVYSLTRLAEPSKSLDTALYALCLTQLRATGRNDVSLYQCLEYYDAALQHLRLALDHHQERFREETVAAILVLSTCELFVSTSGGGWSAHARGVVEIMRWRDPALTSTPAWRHLFSRLRVVCTLEGLVKRRAQYLDLEMGRRIASNTGYNDSLDEVFQMFAEVPGLLERVTPLTLIEDQNLLWQQSAKLVQELSTVVEAVTSWQDEFWKASSTARCWLIPSRASNPADDDEPTKLFPLCFEFQSLSVAVPTVMCWAVVTQIYSNIIQVLSLLQAQVQERLRLGDLLDRPDARSVEDLHEISLKKAHSICQSLEYFHRIEMGTYGGHATTYLRWSARQYFHLHPDCDRERLWLQNVPKMEGPGTRWGVSTMRFEDVPETLTVTSVDHLMAQDPLGEGEALPRC